MFFHAKHPKHVPLFEHRELDTNDQCVLARAPKACSSRLTTRRCSSVRTPPTGCKRSLFFGANTQRMLFGANRETVLVQDTVNQIQTIIVVWCAPRRGSCKMFAGANNVSCMRTPRNVFFLRPHRNFCFLRPHCGCSLVLLSTRYNRSLFFGARTQKMFFDANTRKMFYGTMLLGSNTVKWMQTIIILGCEHSADALRCEHP